MGPEEGAWPPPPKGRRRPCGGEPGMPRGLHYHQRRAGGWHSAQRHLPSRNKGPSSAKQGSCSNKRLLEMGRADWTSQEKRPHLGLLLPSSREERGAAQMLSVAASLHQAEPMCFPSERENSPVFPCLAISKTGSKSVTILQASLETVCFLNPQILVQVTAGELKVEK